MEQVYSVLQTEVHALELCLTQYLNEWVQDGAPSTERRQGNLKAGV